MPPTDAPVDVAVIGGGVIGLACALALAAEDRRVLLVERDRIGAGASSGNAGAFAYADILPLARPGILWRAPHWLLDPLGPLSVRPRSLPALAPWLARFALASRRACQPALIAAQAALLRLSAKALPWIADLAGARGLMRNDGQLQLYEGRRAWEAALPEWEARRAEGMAFEVLKGADAIAELQPGLSPRFTHAGFVPDWPSVSDPMTLLEAMAAAFRGRGGRIETEDVTTLAPTASGGVELGCASGRRIQALQAVLAAGAWSADLARQAGEAVPLAAERGYNTTFSADAFDLRCQLTFPDHGFVVSRAGGLRVGGAVELASPDAPADMRRARVLVDKARRFLPALRAESGREWMGCRPSLPDSLPVICRASRIPALVLAFGHGHLGLTQAPATARIVADLLGGRPPETDITPTAPRVFGA
ncbi:NAD(P)/FAD-dependent oxidoreductase [Jhaorihella thermophila]|uniref:NAD(P)/FAD-dependent oxidoreductase n=1 Tax=Jhaorihella thermophila TaxID=488547 RepID=UPI00362143CF